MHAVVAMKKVWPTLPDKAIVYIEGDRFYYHPTLKIPFQLGPGFMMMVLYYNTGKIPKELIDSWYLLSVQEEGYKVSGNKAFGYFYEINALKDIYAHNPKLKQEQLVGMHYDSTQEKFIDITAQIQSEIRN